MQKQGLLRYQHMDLEETSSIHNKEGKEIELRDKYYEEKQRQKITQA